jgi:DNA (cytosine-5)-methyltransferase 1
MSVDMEIGANDSLTAIETKIQILLNALASRQSSAIRFDGLAGCLRTPAGGSSRQIIVVVDGKSVRSRLLSARETARLMGLPDAYKLPPNYNEAYHLTGDGVVVPLVRHLTRHLFEPLLAQRRIPTRIAA